MTRLPRLVCSFALLLVAGPARADTPHLLVPPRADSTAIHTEAPLLVPGRPSAADSTGRTRAEKALEQYARGMGFEREGAYGTAITSYVNAVRLDPTLRGPNARIGRLYARVGEWGQAALAYAAEVALAPNDHSSARELGLALANLGDSARAVTQLEMLARRRPSDAGIWQALGFVYGSFNRNADAERVLRRALALDGKDAGTWRDLGVVLGRRDRPAEARRAFARARALDPAAAATWLDLGNLELRAGDATRALTAYREAQRRDSLLHAAYDGELRALQVLGRDAERSDTWRRWVAADPEAMSVRLQAIDHFRANGRNDIAIELARDGVRRDARSSTASLALGTALAAGGQHRAALSILRRADSLAVDDRERERAARFVGMLRATAPDSLRALFAADSVAHAKAGGP